MTLGTGLFLSTIVASIVALFIATKDRWQWKKIILWSVAGPIALIAVCSALYYGYEKVSDFPKVQTEYWGIRLGMPKDDVIFMKGKPESSTPDSKSQRETLSYKDNRNHYEIFISTSGRVQAVLCIPDSHYSSAIQGIGYQDTFEKVVNKFGQPSRSSNNKDKSERLHHFSKYNVFFGFAKGVVESIGIDDNESIGYTSEKDR